MWFDFSQSACITTQTPIEADFPQQMTKALLTETNKTYVCTPTDQGYLLTPKRMFSAEKNAFNPVVSISATREDAQTTLTLNGSPAKFTRVFYWLFNLCALVMEVLLLVIFCPSDLDPIFPVFIPLILIVFSFLLTWLGTKLSFRAVVKTIERMLCP